MKGRPSGGKPLLVTVLVFPGVRLLDVTGPIEVFASANEFGGRYRVRMVSPNGADVVTAAGTGFGVDFAAADVDYVSDVVVVPGAPEWPSLVKDDALLDAVRALDARSRRTASICTEPSSSPRPGCSTGARRPRTGASPTNSPCGTRESPWTPTPCTYGTDTS